MKVNRIRVWAFSKLKYRKINPYRVIAFGLFYKLYNIINFRRHFKIKSIKKFLVEISKINKKIDVIIDNFSINKYKEPIKYIITIYLFNNSVILISIT